VASGAWKSRPAKLSQVRRTWARLWKAALRVCILHVDSCYSWMARVAPVTANNANPRERGTERGLWRVEKPPCETGFTAEQGENARCDALSEVRRTWARL